MTEVIYSILILALSIGLGYLGYVLKRTKTSDPRAIFVGFCVAWATASLGSCLWFGVLQNIAARNWGGTMTLNLPANARLINITWKEDSVWYLYYDQASGNCYFKEDSRHGLIEGGVLVKSCNPLGIEK